MSTLASVIMHDLTANRPTAGLAGRLFFASDTGHIWRDNGSGWDDVTPPGGGATAGVVQSNSGNGTSGSVTVAFPSPNTLGNLLVAFGVAFGISTPTDTQGNTWADSGLAPSNGLNGRMWYVTSCHSGANSVTMSGGRAAQLHIFEISGQVVSATLDQSASGQGSSGTTFTVTSGNVVQAKEIVLACFNSNSGSTVSMTAGSGYTQKQSTFDNTTASGNVITTSEVGNATTGLSGTQTATAVGNVAASYWLAMIGTFKLA